LLRGLVTKEETGYISNSSEEHGMQSGIALAGSILRIRLERKW
jgi:hypothetical protein